MKKYLLIKSVFQPYVSVIALLLFTVFLFVTAGHIYSINASKETSSDSQSALTTDFSEAEKNEHLPGGQATSKKRVFNRNAFSHASANMNFKKELNFKVGNGIFKKLWVSAPASTDASDGLGPLHNARSCQRCHIKDGRGHPPEANWPDDNAISMLLRLSIPPQNQEQKKLLATHKINAVGDPVYGGQLQDFAIQGHDSEGKMHINYEPIKVELSGGEVVMLRKPIYRIEKLSYGPLHKDIRVSPRIAPQMIGLGLLEAISEKDVLKNADPDDKDGDGISGRPNLVWSGLHQKVMIGRFGLKAGKPTIKDQSAGAFSGDMGLSTQLIPDSSGDCTVKQEKCVKAPNGNSARFQNVEVGAQMLDLVVFYSQNLAVPRRRNPNDANILKGKKLFYETGCVSCHRPKFKTGKVREQPHLSGQLIWPYTDMLLHDMGEGLADNSPEGVANGREWRTPPLWGIGLTKIVNGHTNFLHDGRARSVKEAILWHGGEAQEARDGFTNLSKKDRELLIAFVKSL